MKILVGYKAEESSLGLLDQVVKHAKAFNASILVFTSLTGETVTEKIERQYAEEDLQKIRNFFEEKSIPCETHLSVEGLAPGEDLIRFAKENRVDEIIIGIKKKSKVGKLLFGSNAQYVILKANCPVLTVKL